MTYRELLQKEHPEKVDKDYEGGCHLCPHSYGYEEDNDNVKPCMEHMMYNDAICAACWDREIPGSEPTGLIEKDVFSKAIATFGEQLQVIMLFEEMAELQKELCKDFRGKRNLENIADEVADVEIMLAQIKMLYGIADKVQKHREFKVSRLAQRLKEGT